MKQGFNYLVDNVIATLIINLKKTYDEVMEMEVENAFYTYSVFYINAINSEIK